MPRAGVALPLAPAWEGERVQVRPTRLVLPLRLTRLEQSEAVVRVGDKVHAGQILSRPLGIGARGLRSPLGGRVEALSVRPVSLPSIFAQAAGPLPLPCVELGGLDFSAPREGAWRHLEGHALRERLSGMGLEGEEGLPLDLELDLLPPGSRLVIMALSQAPALDAALLEVESARLEAAVAALCRLRDLRDAMVLHAPSRRESASRLVARLSSLLPAKAHSVAGGHPWSQGRLALCAAGLPFPSPRRTLASQGVLVCGLGRLLAIEGQLSQACPGPFPIEVQSWRGTRHLPEAAGSSVLAEVWPGTPLRDLLTALGRDPHHARELVLDGHPLTASPLLDPDQPLLPGHLALGFLPDPALPSWAEGPCISCGQCLDICPLRLTPVRLARLVEEGRVGDARRLGLESCVDCGLCSWICPSRLELGHSLRKGRHLLREARHGA